MDYDWRKAMWIVLVACVLYILLIFIKEALEVDILFIILYILL